MSHILLKTRARTGNAKNVSDIIGSNTHHIHAQTAEHTKEMNNAQINNPLNNWCMAKPNGRTTRITKTNLRAT